MTHIILEGEVLNDEVEYGAATLLRVCRLEEVQLHAMVDAGVVTPQADAFGHWRFRSAVLQRVRTAQLNSDLQLDLDAVALILELLEERAALKQRVRLHEQFFEDSVRA